jgi:hypothetical protein
MASNTSGLTDYSSAVVTTASLQLAPQNKGRQYLLVQNLSDVVVYVNVTGGTAAATAGNIYLAANGGSIIWEGNDLVPSAAVKVIAASSSGKSVTCLEG